MSDRIGIKDHYERINIEANKVGLDLDVIFQESTAWTSFDIIKATDNSMGGGLSCSIPLAKL